MKRTFRRIVAGILMIAMILPITALAAEYDLSNGDISVSVGNDGQYVTQAENDINNQKDETPIVIKQNAGTTTSNTITINAGEGSQATVTIEKVNIEAQGEAAITTTGDVTIQVSGENHVSSDGTAIKSTGSLTITGAPGTEQAPATTTDENSGEQSAPAVEVPENSLTVEGENTAIDVTSSDGELTIGNGGDETKGDIEVNAIGGEVGIDANVTVDDGYLNAYGDVYGTTSNGIGIDGDLTVNSGDLTVTGGKCGVYGDVKINGGEVTIENDELGNNISYDYGIYGNLTVNNGDVTVTSNNLAVTDNVTITGGEVEIANNPHTTEGHAIGGNLTVTSGTATVYGYGMYGYGSYAAVLGDVAVGATGNVSIHSYTDAVDGSTTVADGGALTLHDQAHKDADCDYTACNQTMIYSKSSNGTFDIQGVYTYKDSNDAEQSAVQQTTYSNAGYETYLRINDTKKLTDISGAKDVDGLNIKVDLVPKKDGKVLQIVYTVTNKSKASITFDLGSAADVQIGNDDYAQIIPLLNDQDQQIGFKMVDGILDAQFNFFGKNDTDITDVDTFWYGHYGSRAGNVFSNVPEVYNGTYDSGMAWSWLDNTVDAGESLTFTVLIGIGGKGSEGVAGGVVVPPDDNDDNDSNDGIEVPAIPEPEPEPTPDPAPAPAAPASQLTIKLDTVDKVIDLAASTQDGKPMEKIEAATELTSGKALAPEDSIVVHKAETTADETVENMVKEDVAMAFTVAYLRNGVVSNMPGKAKISIPSPADSLEGYVLVFILENGKQIEIPYELIDGKVIFTTDRIGLYMLVKK